MPVAYYVKHPELPLEQYEESMRRLEEAGLGGPRGRLYHFAFSVDGSVRILSIWDSPSSYDEFAKRLKQVAVDTGITPIEPETFEVVNIVTGV